MNSREELYLEACRQYQLGTPIMSDAEFDQLEAELGKKVSDITYDEASVSESIKALRSEEEAKEWLSQFKKGTELIVSLKIDGLRVKIINSKALSRNLKEDYSDAMKDFIATVGDHFIEVNGEAYVVGVSDSFETERGMTMSLLSRGYSSKELRFAVHNTGSENYRKGLNKALELGLEIVPYRTVVYHNPEEFIEKVQGMFENASQPSDGLVVRTNNEKDKQVIAFKFGRYSSEDYQSIVKEIIFNQKSEKMGIVAKVVPVTIKNGNKVSKVHIHSPKFMIEKDIRPGKVIKFITQAGGFSVARRD